MAAPLIGCHFRHWRYPSPNEPKRELKNECLDPQSYARASPPHAILRTRLSSPKIEAASPRDRFYRAELVDPRLRVKHSRGVFHQTLLAGSPSPTTRA
jgi:hypothetical protein